MTTTSLPYKIALSLTIIGGVNWGSIGLFDCNLVAILFNQINPVISRIIYTLVGISALYVALVQLRTPSNNSHMRFKA